MRQGCVSSPDLFKLYSEAVIKELETIPGFIISRCNLNIIRYANDTLLVERERKLQDLDKAIKEKTKHQL